MILAQIFILAVGVKKIGRFVNGTKHGKWLRFDESGLVISENNYAYGLQHGRQFTKGSYDMYEYGRWLGVVGKSENFSFK